MNHSPSVSVQWMCTVPESGLSTRTHHGKRDREELVNGIGRGVAGDSGGHQVRGGQEIPSVDGSLLHLMATDEPDRVIRLIDGPCPYAYVVPSSFQQLDHAVGLRVTPRDELAVLGRPGRL